VDEALTVSDSAPDMAALMMSLAGNICALSGDVRRAVEHCERAEAIALKADPITQIGCRSITTHVRISRGDAVDLAAEIQEFELISGLIGEGASEQLLVLGQLFVFDLMILGRWESADELAGRVVAQARASGLRGVESFVHGIRGEVAWRRGRWLEARAEALFEVEFDEAHDGTGGSFAHATLARVDAAMGRLDPSVRNATLTVDRGLRIGMGALESWGRQARALAALADGQPESALLDTRTILELTQMGGVGEPGILWWHGDHLEALWRTSDVDGARRFVSHLGDQATRTGSRWASAISLRGNGLLSRDADALRESGDALDAMDAPFEAARSRALLAEIGSPPEFRSELSGAVEVFSELGAHPWATRLAAMLGEEPSSPDRALDSLTEAELRVAAAVSRGLTNRDAADLLFLSPKTVDAHLQRIYRKLDVRSRTELAVRLSQAQDGRSSG
jgi:DNA-binding CsgD family transcriptional regulator